MSLVSGVNAAMPAPLLPVAGVGGVAAVLADGPVTMKLETMDHGFKIYTCIDLCSSGDEQGKKKITESKIKFEPGPEYPLHNEMRQALEIAQLPVQQPFPYYQQEPFSQDDHDDDFNVQHDNNNEDVTDGGNQNQDVFCIGNGIIFNDVTPQI